MEVHVSAEIEQMLTDLAATSGRRRDDLVQDALAGYFEELARVRETLDGRYDDVKSGLVEPLDGEAAYARLRARSEDRRSRSV